MFCHELGLLLFLSLTHSVVRTHTHTLTYTHMHTDTYTYSLPHLFVITTSVRADLQWHLFSLSNLIIPSIYSGCACGSLSDYCKSCIECGLLLVVDLRICTLYRLELLWVSGFLGVLLLPPVSPVPRGPSRLKSLGPDRLQFCFVIFLPVLCLRTTYCLVFAPSLKTVLTNPFAFGSFTLPIVTVFGGLLTLN